MAGRPPAFKNVEELQTKITAYLKTCKPHPEKQWGLVKKRVGSSYNWVPKEVEKLVSKPITIVGLCVFLDISRETWSVYSDKKPFSDTCKRFKTMCEEYSTQLVLDPNNKNAAGPMFNLKANHGLVDKQVTDETQHVIIEHKEIGA